MAARQAILGPIREYNRYANAQEQAIFDPALADRVIEELMEGSIDADNRVQGSYLQLVMTTWWDREAKHTPPWMFSTSTLLS